MLKFYCGVVVLFFCNACFGQTKFEYKNIPDSYISAQKNNYPRSETLVTENLYEITKSLPPNHVKDGSVDYTKFIQSALNSHRNVIFPNYPLLINKNGLSISSNSKLVFSENSVLIMAPNSLDTYQILRVHNVTNVTLVSPTIRGDRTQHLGKKGEWGMGLSIMGSSSIKVYNPRINNCWGDGIYIGKGTDISKDVEIYNPILDNNRRNGISIVSVDGLLIKSPIISNTNGTMPMSGIDIEPNNNNDVVDNISIIDPVTFNNERFGILLVLRNLPGPKRKNVNVMIYNHLDDTSLLGVRVSGFNNRYSKGLPLKGSIEIVKPNWINNKQNFTVEKSIYAPNISIQK